ncbi:MAG: hypothetical protein JSS68_08315 [Actinobacteria bacterium]|nr:hypothetical protein [Actinomycetota bacterium]
MSDRRRHRAFALSVLFAAAVCVAVWAVERPRPGGATGVAATAPNRSPLVLGAAAPAPSTGEAGAPAPRLPHQAGALPEKASIIVTARRFTAAFVQYEVGRLPTGARRTIQSTATLSFASSLLSAPPSIPNGVRPPPPARVRSVAIANGPEGGQAAVAVELLAVGGKISSLTELLLRSGREWRISGLG